MSHNPKMDMDPARHQRLKIAAVTHGYSIKDLGGVIIDRGLDDLESGELELEGRPDPHNQEPATEEAGV